MQDQENQELSQQGSGAAQTGANGADQATAATNEAAQASAGQAGVPPTEAVGTAQSDLEAQLSATEAKLAEMHDAFMRAKADAENIRRRAQEDVSKAHKFAIESFAEAMVPVRDSLEMALKVETQTVEAIREGVEMTLKQLTAAFEKNRLVEVMPQPGDKLDPNKHQAVAVVPSEQEANTVVTVLQKGYMIADRLLRPAIVTAAAPK
ncbi:nucleotide exchange factor GrpE [Massilia sp. BSC265]|uniref:nucleotide exchange factor GrpE n=1 Tax=Massilia sp. BSC265 TaxID=1549812 RepID=UPI0004E8DB7C|nr:nucleotide exchange factor GrpE [Massilia sp. BSC265]KFI06067.1 protein GrpE [Massilia sp. BSC265]